MTDTAALPLRVYKFGGSSLGSPERLERALTLMFGAAQQSQLAVVVSALGDTTDWLLEGAAAAGRGDLDAAVEVVDRVASLARANAQHLRNVIQISPDHDENLDALIDNVLEPLRPLFLGMSLLREQTAQATDLVLSFGERLSASLVAALLRCQGLDAHFVDARTWAVTDDNFGDAVIDWPSTRANIHTQAETWRQHITVHTGFLAQTPNGRTTTLGRNGSDYTATLLGRGLGAEEVVVCTDVPGVMTGDPTIIHDAYPVRNLSYLEAVELANYGTRMFHPRTMLPLIASGIPMTIRSTMDLDAPGTRIDTGTSSDERRPTCVTSLERLALLEVRSRALAKPARLGRHVISAVEQAGITVWMANQAAQGQSVALVVPQDEATRAEHAVREALLKEFAASTMEPLRVTAPVTLLSLVAEQMAQHETFISQLFGALSEVGVRVLATAQGGRSRSISCVISAADTVTAVRTVHAAFNFAHQEVSICVLGKGVVGGRLLEQIQAQRDTLEADHDVALRMVALVDSQHMLFHEQGIPLDDPVNALTAKRPQGAFHKQRTPGDDDMNTLLDMLQRCPLPILVDATAVDGHEVLFHNALQRGIHVVSANKKPFASDQASYRNLLDAARQHHRSIHYETTVGASLPVIETLKDLRRTGDRVHRIEGALSGTLGYLTNEAMAGTPLSQAVREAVAKGYAEPQPQDDLSGMDVARKGLILARELGLDIDIADVSVEPLVPQEFLDITDVDAFLAKLETYDKTFQEAVERNRQEGRVLRYLAVVDPTASPVVKVGPVAVPNDHPSTRLRGTEAFVAFTTDRFATYPLIVQGPGAGGDVTAAGVLTDILRIARTLRGA